MEYSGNSNDPDAINTRVNKLVHEFGIYLNEHKDDFLKDILNYPRQHWIEYVNSEVYPGINDELLRLFFDFLKRRRARVPDFELYRSLGDIKKIIEYALLLVD